MVAAESTRRGFMRCGVGAVVYGGGGVEVVRICGPPASSFDAVIAGLQAGPWSGPASVAMAGAAAPCVGVVESAAGQAVNRPGESGNSLIETSAGGWSLALKRSKAAGSTGGTSPRAPW